MNVALDALKKSREHIYSEASVLGQKILALESSGNERQRLVNELAELARRESESLVSYISNGRKGAPPNFGKERDALADQIAALDRGGTEGETIEALREQEAKILQRVTFVNDQIESAVITEFESAVACACEERDDAARKFGEARTRVEGVKAALFELSNAFARSRRDSLKGRVLSLISAVRPASDDHAPTMAAIESAKREFLTNVESLRK